MARIIPIEEVGLIYPSCGACYAPSYCGIPYRCLRVAWAHWPSEGGLLAFVRLPPEEAFGSPPFGTCSQVPSTEDFEDENDFDTTFQVDGDPEFTLSGVLSVGVLGGWGHGGSQGYIDTYWEGPQSGVLGSVTIAPGSRFTVVSFRARVSATYAASFTTGSLKFTGALASGGTATETVEIASEGGYALTSFSGDLAGAHLTSLEIEIPPGSPVDYIVIDDFSYTHRTHPVAPWCGMDAPGCVWVNGEDGVGVFPPVEGSPARIADSLGLVWERDPLQDPDPDPGHGVLGLYLDPSDPDYNLLVTEVPCSTPGMPPA